MFRNAAVSLIIVLAINTIVVTSRETMNCGPNEVFNSCGTACEPSCQDPTPNVCIFSCVIGCQCKDGFIRNAAGDCVLTQDCN